MVRKILTRKKFENSQTLDDAWTREVNLQKRLSEERVRIWAASGVTKSTLGCACAWPVTSHALRRSQTRWLTRCHNRAICAPTKELRRRKRAARRRRQQWRSCPESNRIERCDWLSACAEEVTLLVSRLELNASVNNRLQRPDATPMKNCPKSEKVAKYCDFHLFCCVFTLCRIEDLRRPELLHQIWRHLEENYDFNLKRRRFDAARDAVCDWSINHDVTSKFKTQWRHGNHVRRNDGMSRGYSETISSNRLMRPLRRNKFEFF